ncbi:transcription antitermination factor NusB [Thiovibrio frasassiensis]|jgi:N utilization substance protein B|uniref:Transcription antitermination protein NusB n=1 Tax=Thiovibrio frasassiensis TaxID=2984131 RepID=A0A9X4RMP4_9BACT|nr:transcription antitermination factor NusB [Thiovibrio frasassiensis]MDG4476408.1 transcription antitermination factor NusB [Thiovibrio frasassiensis]
MGNRRKARELALNALFQGEMTETSAVENFPLLCENFEINKKAIPYGQELVEGITDNWEVINAKIAESAVNWRVSRMSVLDRNIIRLAAYELMYKEEVPPRVAIDEAIELAKRYCGEDSPGFINGILDAILKNIGKEK